MIKHMLIRHMLTKRYDMDLVVDQETKKGHALVDLPDALHVLRQVVEHNLMKKNLVQ
jgi:hypothetical protein